MKTLDYINEMGGTQLDLQTWEGKWFLRRIATMPPNRNLAVHPLLRFISYPDYMYFLGYHKKNLQ